MKKIILILLIGFLANCENQPKSYKYGIPEEEYSQILLGLINVNSSTNSTYGTVKFTGTRLEWKRCAQGQSYRSANNDCQGNSSPTNFTPIDLKYGATQHTYCNTASNSCNSLELVPILNSATTSTTLNVTAYVSCSTDTTGVSTGSVTAGSWRVPTVIELVALSTLGRVATYQTFPNIPDEKYWSSTSEVTDLTGEVAQAVNFSLNGFGDTEKVKKDTKLYLRCVRSY